jgi:HEAT repeat protein
VARLTLLGERAVGALAAAAESPDPVVRLGAVDALDRIGSRRGLPALMQALGDGDTRVSILAVQALGRLHAGGLPDAFEPLVGLLVDEDASEDLRLHALDAIRGLDDREMRPLLTRLLQTPHPRLRRAAASLERRKGRSEGGGDQSVPTIPDLHREIQELSAGGRPGTPATARAKARIHVALARLDSRIALYDLREMLESRPVRDAGDLLEAAALIGDRSMLPVVVALAHDEPGLLEPSARAFARIVERERISRGSSLLRTIPHEQRSTFEELWRSRAVTPRTRATKTRGPSR